jgi:hypothetical protein
MTQPGYKQTGGVAVAVAELSSEAATWGFLSRPAEESSGVPVAIAYGGLFRSAAPWFCAFNFTGSTPEFRRRN